MKYSLFCDEDEFLWRLVHLKEIDEPGVFQGLFQHHHFPQDLLPAGLALAALLDELGSNHLLCLIVDTLLHHGKLTPEIKKIKLYIQSRI